MRQRLIAHLALSDTLLARPPSDLNAPSAARQAAPVLDVRTMEAPTQVTAPAPAQPATATNKVSDIKSSQAASMALLASEIFRDAKLRQKKPQPQPQPQPEESQQHTQTQPTNAAVPPRVSSPNGAPPQQHGSSDTSTHPSESGGPSDRLSTQAELSVAGIDRRQVEVESEGVVVVVVVVEQPLAAVKRMGMTSLPFYEWNACAATEKKEYLEKKLDAAVGWEG